jgi:hypothetical protein
MDRSQKEDGAPQGPVTAAFSVFNTLVDSPGRRNVRIFGLPHEQMTAATALIICVGIPLALFVAILPFWDHVGEWMFIKRMNSYVAPAIYAVPHQYDPESTPRVPLKRFLIASTSMVEIVLLSNFVALAFRGVRRHALLVWRCHDRKKIFRYFGVAAVAFCGLWYILFSDWTSLASLGRAAGRLMLYAVMALPFVAIVFGHMAAIVSLGALRDVSQGLRRFRKASR